MWIRRQRESMRTPKTVYAPADELTPNIKISLVSLFLLKTITFYI